MNHRGMGIGLLAALVLASAAPQAKNGKEAVRRQLKDEIVGNWIYDDMPAGFAEARKTGKPILVTFR
jgi:hypothetical protein